MAIPTWLWSSEEPDGERRREPAAPVSAASTPSSAVHPGRSRSATRERREGTSAIESRARSGSEPDRDLERVSSDLEALANPVRLEILTALARAERPLRYSELRATLSIEDNGKLNYHLRTLEDLVASADGEYRLTDRGRDLVGRVLDVESAEPRTTSRVR